MFPYRPLVAETAPGPELPLQRSNNAAVQLSLSGRSCFAQHLDRFKGIRPNDVANRDTCGVAALHLQYCFILNLKNDLLQQGAFR